MTSQVSSTSNVLLYFIAIFIPPIPVFLKRGCAADFWINICLWILGWIPGVIHAWYIISRSEGAMGSSRRAVPMGTTGGTMGTTGAAMPVGTKGALGTGGGAVGPTGGVM